MALTSDDITKAVNAAGIPDVATLTAQLTLLAGQYEILTMQYQVQKLQATRAGDNAAVEQKINDLQAAITAAQNKLAGI